MINLEKLERGTLPDAVGELMARSGGFNVPADYFRATGMPAPVPGSPLRRRQRWPLYATIAAGATLVGLVGAIAAHSTSSPAQTVPAGLVVTATAIAPTPAPVAVIAPTAVSVTRPTHEVLLSVSPGDATVTRDGSNLGQQPIVLHMADGENATLVVARKGYKTKSVTVDGIKPRQSLSLEPLGSAAPRPPTASTGPALGIDDVGDPFANKKR